MPSPGGGHNSKCDSARSWRASLLLPTLPLAPYPCFIPCPLAPHPWFHPLPLLHSPRTSTPSPAAATAARDQVSKLPSPEWWPHPATGALPPAVPAGLPLAVPPRSDAEQQAAIAAACVFRRAAKQRFGGMNVLTLSCRASPAPCLLQRT